MSFVGKLDQFRLTDLLQIISTTGKSGRLSLTRRDAEGVVVFRQGKIIYAASTSARETLGSLLLCQNLIEESDLLAALEVQHQAEEEKRLGTILVEIGALDAASLARVVGQQIEKVVTEFMQWKTGFFKFDLMKVADQGEVAVDAQDFVIQQGLSTDRVLLAIATKLDELEHDEAMAEGQADAEARAASEAGEGEPATGETTAELSSLKSIMTQIRSPEFTGELTIKILNYARTVVRRGVLFVVRQDGYCGMGQFGVELAEGSADERVRSLRLPVDQPSMLSEAAERKASYRGEPGSSEWDRRLIEELGGMEPAEVVVVPMVVNDQVLLLLYGDTAGGADPVGAVDRLELLMLQAGLAMEKSLLEKRLERVESQSQI